MLSKFTIVVEEHIYLLNLDGKNLLLVLERVCYCVSVALSVTMRVDEAVPL